MKPFFESDQIIKKNLASNKENTLNLSCEDCRLYKNGNFPKMPPYGSFKKKILIIGECINETENIKGKPFIGTSGQFLRDCLKQLHIDMDQDCLTTNALICYTNDKEPTDTQVKCCRSNIMSTIAEYKPEKIITLGKYSLLSLIGHRTSNFGMISKWVGWKIPDQTLKAFIYPNYHPSFILRNNNNRAAELLFKKYLREAIRDDREFPIDTGNVTILTNENEIIQYLEKILREKPIITPDFEATGKKLHKKEHKILCMAFSTDPYSATSFPFLAKNETFLRLIQAIFLDKAIKKTGWNLMYERAAGLNKLGCDIEGLLYDGMIGSHLLDNRSKITGLKIQNYLNCGSFYADEIKPYIISKDDSGNAFNRMERLFKTNPMLVLEYCGQDAMREHRLFRQQWPIIQEKYKEPYEIFHNGILALNDMEERGFCIDYDYYKKKYDGVQRRIRRIEKNLQESKEAILYQEKRRKILNPKSDKQLIYLFYSLLGYDSTKTTEKGNASVDQDTLKEIGTEFTEMLLEYRKLIGYEERIDGYFREVVGNKIYPKFWLNLARTYRSCISKGTYIEVVRDVEKNPKGIPIENVKSGDYVYCFDNNLKPAIRKVVWAGKTGYKQVIRLHWKSSHNNSGYLDLTPEHLVRHISGKYYRADQLKGDLRTSTASKHTPKISVLSLRRKNDELYFTGVVTKHNKGIFDHRLVYSQIIGSLDDGDVIHHIDNNHLNNHPSNLNKVTISQHSALHYKSNIGINSKENRAKNVRIVKKLWKEGRYTKAVRCKEKNYTYLNLTKCQCLKLLAKAGGRISAVCHDYTIFINYCNRYNINYKYVRMRYNSKREYLNRGVVRKAYITYNKSIAKQILKCSRKHYQYLLNYYKIELINNHIITKIEYINKYVDVYDIEVEEFSNFIANGICVHNSASNPNVMSIIKRDEEGCKLIRTGIKPRKGHQLLGIDYGKLEVFGSLFNHHDPNMKTYLLDPNTDMHRDTSVELYLVDPIEELTSQIRTEIKNGAVFPWFYGSYYAQIAKDLWKFAKELKIKDGTLLIAHLKKKGITSYEKFERHVQKAEDIFWNKRFRVYAKWKDKIWEEYQNQGYIENLAGFRFSGLMNKKDVSNYPIQSISFLIMLYALTEFNRICKEEKLDSYLILEIHDEMIVDVCPDELDYIKKLVKECMLEKTRERFKFISVPLQVEAKISEIDGNWFDMKKCEL